MRRQVFHVVKRAGSRMEREGMPKIHRRGGCVKNARGVEAFADWVATSKITSESTQVNGLKEGSGCKRLFGDSRRGIVRCRGRGKEEQV